MLLFACQEDSLLFLKILYNHYNYMEVILTSLPLIIIFFLIVMLRWSAIRAALAALFSLLIIVIFVWQMPLEWILASSLKGFLISLEITIIIFGAIFFLNILRKTGLEKKFQKVIQEISADRRIQALIIGWAFVHLIEGSAGFCTPAMLAAPFLFIIGFPPIAAVIVALIGNAVPPIFGALGVPIIFGFGKGLTSPAIINYLNEQGLSLIQFLNQQVTPLIASFNLITGFLVCLAIIIVLIFSFGSKKDRRFQYVLEFIPYLILASFLVTIPAWLMAYFFGPELPSLVGGLVGLILLLIITKKGWLAPKNQWDFDKIRLRAKPQQIEKYSKRQGINNLQGFAPLEESAYRTGKKICQVFSPYFLLVLILFLSRADFLPFKNWLENFGRFSLPPILGVTIDYSFSPFYSIGVLLIFIGLIISAILSLKFFQIKNILKDSLSKIKKPFLTLIVILIFVKLFIYSGENLAGYLSMPLILSQTIVDITQTFWPIFAPMIGIFGAFLAGSATVSNILFANVQVNAALMLQIDPRLILSLQGIGASLGNMIAIHNIIAVLAVMGLIGKEAIVIRRNLLPVLIIGFLLGIIGFVLSKF